MLSRAAVHQQGLTAGRIDLHSKPPSVKELMAYGRSLREQVAREAHSGWKPAKGREDVLKTIARDNRGRIQRLIPIRMHRMAVSPFTFFRGSASVMARDLAAIPASGITAVIDGDAHLSNYGLYGTALRGIVFDLNDFDETIIGPWEWDLKRLTASINVAGRVQGMSKSVRRDAVLQAVSMYQQHIGELAKMGTLDIWYLHSYPNQDEILQARSSKTNSIVRKAMLKAQESNNHSLLQSLTEVDAKGDRKIRSQPPVFTIAAPETKAKVTKALEQYALTLTRERLHMLARYRVVDVVHQVVGVGSVGRRVYVALLLGKSEDDPLFLQVKEAAVSVYAAVLPPAKVKFAHQGERVVVGQRALQAASDVLLGWTEMDGRSYYVRQLKNFKAAIPFELMNAKSFSFYASACASLLARGHARTAEAAAIAGYCGTSKVFSQSLADWAEAYGNQTVLDHARLVAAIKARKIEACEDVLD